MSNPKASDDIVTASVFSGVVSVTIAGIEVAKSSKAVELIEDGYPPVFYLPQEDIDMAHFAPSESKTLCPHKGIASYWSYENGAVKIEDVAWTYKTPVSSIGDISGCWSFYKNKVDAIKIEPA